LRNGAGPDRLRVVKRRWSLLLLAMVVLVGAAWWLWRPRKPQPTTTLADGSRFIVQGVTVSRNPTWCFGNLLQELGAKVPGRLGDRLSRNTRLQLGDQGQSVLAIWFSIERKGGASTFPPSFEARLKGTSSATVRFFTRLQQVTPTRAQGALYTSTWPRRFKEFTLEWSNSLLEGASNGITFPNPSVSQAPPWVAEPLPAARHTNGLKFTLHRVSVQSDPEPTNALASVLMQKGRTPVTRTTLDLDIEGSDRPTDSRQLMRLVLMDATGNQAEAPIYRMQSRPGELLNRYQVFGWPVMPGEAVVKMWVECVRTSGFKPEEIINLLGVTVGQGPFSTNLPSGRLCFFRFNDQMSLTPPKAWMSTLTGHPSSRRYLLLAVTDDEGRDFPIRNWSQFTLEPGVTTVNLRVAVPPVQWVEWTVPAGGTR